IGAVGLGHLAGQVGHAVVDAGLGHAGAGVDALDHAGSSWEREAARYATGAVAWKRHVPRHGIGGARTTESARARCMRATRGARPSPSPTTEQHDGELSRPFPTPAPRTGR